MTNTSLYTCALCKQEFPFGDVKYTDDGRKIVCSSCYGRHKKDLERKNKIEEKSIKEEAIKVACNKCRYRFTLKKSSKQICPYCGGDDFSLYENYTAQKFIDETIREGGEAKGY